MSGYISATRFLSRMRGVAVLAALAILGFSSGGITAGHAESLEEAVKLSLSNPEIRAAQANRRAVDQDKREAEGLYYPTVDLRAGMGKGRLDSPTTRASGTDDEWMWRRDASLVIVQRLYDGGKVSNQVERQQARVAAAAARVLERTEFVGLDAVQAYLDVLRQLELVRLAEGHLQDNILKLSDVGDRVRGGRSGIADQRQAENRVAQARSDLITVQRSYDESRSLYRRVVGTEPSQLSRPALPASVLPASLEDARTKARRMNPSVISASREVAAADAQIRINDSSWHPQVDLELTANQGSDMAGIQGSTSEYKALVVARWNLYSGGSDTARRSGSVERSIQAREELRAAVLKSYEETERSWIAMVRQNERANVLRDRVKSAEGVLAAYTQQFTVGQRDLLDVLDAQNDLFIVRSELLTAGYSSQFAGYRILAVTGELMSSLNVAALKESSDAGVGGAIDGEGKKKTEKTAAN
jgi:adhesin transport system outer membrane protein